MQNTRLDESQAGIKIAERNINNFRYVDDMTLTVDSEEELKNLLMKVKETSEKAGLYLWRIHFDIWQNQYNIVKLQKKTKKTQILLCCSVAKSRVTLRPHGLEAPSTPGLHYLPEFA